VSKFGRNDPCWCGSGKKYKKCHLDREREKSLPLAAVLDQVRRAGAISVCLHPNAATGVCSQVVSAHTIQRSRVLKALIGEDRHVLTFHPAYAQSPLDQGPNRVGWREASTISGFCGKHDSETFAPLERTEFTGSWQQCFLLGYRALCHEIYEKRRVASSYEERRNLVDRGHSPNDQVAAQDMLKWHNWGVQKGLADLERTKTVFNRVLLSGDLAPCRAAAIEFSGEVCLATTGTMTPDIDLEGNQLQVLHDLSKPVEWLSVAVDVTAGGGTVVLCWLDGAAEPAQFVEGLLRQPPDRLLQVLPQLIFLYLENTYFSDAWWQGLSEKHQAHVRALAKNSNPYYSKGIFLDEPLTPWTMARIRTHGAS
jgi:hypothetical protein